ncbi:MAG: TolC family protein [Pirellulaceae bacterium]|nr:TolC family protein [Pirellulaceae bacterium]
MSRPIVRWAAYIQICVVLISGCAPTQPFFIAKNGNALGEYLDQAMAIEYADVKVESLPESTQAQIPFGPSHVPDNFVDMTLEDCISIAIQNSKIFRVVNGSNQLSGSVAAALLSAGPGQMPSTYDAAITASTASTQPPAIDNNGNRIPLRGAVRANQVGGVEDALSEFDAQFSALAGYNTTDRPRNVGPGNVFNPQFFQAVDANTQAALSKRTATGGVVTSRLTGVYSHNNIPTSIVNAANFGRSVPSDYTLAAELQVTHPLMRGRGTLVNRIPIVLARINEDIALHQFESNVTNLIKSVEDAYWDLYAGYRVFDSNKKALEASVNLWRVANARLQSDGAPEAEAQANALYQQFASQLHASLNGSTVPGNDPRGLRGREQVLREKMGWSPTDGQFIRPIDNPTIARIEFNWYDVTAEGLTRNVHLRQQKWGIKQRELELVSAKNQILPQVDATGFYRWVGVGDELASANRTGIQFPNPGSNALEELTHGGYQEVGARLEITPPAFGARRPLANIQSSRLQIAKGVEELKEKELMLVHEISSAWRLMESNFMSMKLNFDWWQANEKEISIYNDRIKGSVGELSQLLDNLLRAEQRRAQAETQYHQAVTEYNKSIVNVHYLKGSLLDLNSVSLQEGQWVDKAYWDARERAREREAGTYLDYGYTRPAVVSNGPVESGMLTEGNAARPGMEQKAVPESQEEEESEDKTEGKNSDEKAPVASNFWNGFGSGESQPPAVVTSSGRNAVRTVSDSSVPSSSDEAVQPTASISLAPSAARPATVKSNASISVGKSQANAAGQTSDAQWRPKNR